MDLADFTPQIIARFWSYVEIKGPTECWNWTKSHWNGYGRFHYRPDRPVGKAHRIAFFLKKGDPENYIVRHLCHNPKCCNWDHLAIGTDKDNSDDKLKAGRFKGRDGTGALLDAEIEKVADLIRQRGLPRARMAEIMGWKMQRLHRAIRVVRNLKPDLLPNWRMRNIFSEEQLLEILNQANARKGEHDKLADELGIKLGSLRAILKKFRKAERDGKPLFYYWGAGHVVGKSRIRQTA